MSAPEPRVWLTQEELEAVRALLPKTAYFVGEKVPVDIGVLARLLDEHGALRTALDVIRQDFVLGLGPAMAATIEKYEAQMAEVRRVWAGAQLGDVTSMTEVGVAIGKLGPP